MRIRLIFDEYANIPSPIGRRDRFPLGKRGQKITDRAAHPIK
jgi:hypothetical protein